MIDVSTAAARSLPLPLFGVMALPSGMGGGFLTVTLGYLLTHHGFSVAAVAGLLSLALLPSTLKFLVGPIIDTSLTPRLWYLIAITVAATAAASFAVVPLRPSFLALLTIISVLLTAATSFAGSAKNGVIALTVPVGRRGVLAGWSQSGNLGGVGLGGGAALWIATHAGGIGVAALALAVAILVCGAPMLWARMPPATTAPRLIAQLGGLGRAMLELVRSRSGLLAMISLVLPLGLGAAGHLLPAVAGDWRASADLVALTTGALAGLTSIPGCLIGGYFCGRFPPRTVLMASGLACGFGEAAMAWSPHTPLMFATFVLLNSLLLGVNWAATSGVTFAALPVVGAATVGAVLSSLANIPVAGVTAFVGGVQVRHGSSAMLLAEAGLACAAVAAYGLLVWLWRPAPNRALTVRP